MTSLRSAVAALNLEVAAFLPGDSGYDRHRAGWNLAFDHRPAVIVAASSVSDVVTAVRIAREHHLRVAIQSTGHGVVRPADHETLLLTLANVDHVAIDPRRRRATLGGGAKWTHVLAAAQDHGLAPRLGSAPHVGAVGYTLGGGFGWLPRRYGLAVDHVDRLSIVLADGSVVETSATDHADLFWAMLGAGTGCLGVVVEMQIGLVPVTDVYAGNLLYPLDATMPSISTSTGHVASAKR
jgi:FAD/FMN-containing dehydrogenase